LEKVLQMYGLWGMVAAKQAFSLTKEPDSMAGLQCCKVEMLHHHSQWNV